MNFIYDLHQVVAGHKLIFIYQGDFTRETTKSILTMAERNLDSSGEASGIKKKVFNVMVEVLQNIVKHSDEAKDRKDVDHHAAIFLIGQERSQYSIMSGNPVKNVNIPALSSALDRISRLDKEGLKKLYREIIRKTTISDKSGAGLGFVDMARKSGEKIEWAFVPMSEEISFFCLKVNIVKQTASNNQ